MYIYIIYIYNIFMYIIYIYILYVVCRFPQIWGTTKDHPAIGVPPLKETSIGLGIS